MLPMRQRTRSKKQSIWLDIERPRFRRGRELVKTLWVKMRKTRSEHNESGLPPKADIRADMDFRRFVPTTEVASTMGDTLRPAPKGIGIRQTQAMRVFEGTLSEKANKSPLRESISIPVRA